MTASVWLCTNPWRHVAMAIKFCTMAACMCASSVWNLLHVTLLIPRILRWLLDFPDNSYTFNIVIGQPGSGFCLQAMTRQYLDLQSVLAGFWGVVTQPSCSVGTGNSVLEIKTLRELR